MARLRALALNWGPTIVFNVVLPYLTYAMLTDRGMPDVAALAISGVWPAAEVLVIFLIRRRVDDFGVLTLVVVALGVLSSLAFQSARLALVKESVATGLFGVILLGSLVMSRPLMFYFGRKFATDGSDEGLARWNALWQYPGFRRVQRILTLVWGLAYLAEAIVRVVLSYQLPTSTMVVVSTVLPIAVTAALVTWTIMYARRSRAAAARANPAAMSA
ncbi:VC0807 family protein [Sphaerisporangium fuscum]|uniref:VC0807 family protein n=1 Tax=Sphaerisporangium fuscum TaxID=2835868 RepID=UPI001BDDB8EF|nr:VC0807 family protein [Sphaerisporangium fuscum]